ncbi:MAG TPA: DUF4270 family protein [Hanamia sp.]|nr:DUF4270 family protein [Hanamia sp.]
MSKTQYKSAFTGILILFLFAFGCTKIDTTSLGQNLIPVVDNIHTFDTTFNIIGINYDDNECDTINRSSLFPLGIISNDPLFGSSRAAIYVELKPSSFPYTFPTADANSFVVDSAILVMSYSHTFGDTSALAKVNVYQLADSFHVADNYTTCKVLGYDNSSLLGTKSYFPYVLKDSVHAYQEEAANQLRIPLSNAFIQKFITDSAQIFRSDSDFINYFKGFAIVPDEATGGQGLNYFDFTASRLSIYLRYKNATVADTSVINFAVTGSSGLSNSLIRDRGTSEITKHLSHPATGDSLIYIQTSPGTYALLTVPGLNNLSNRVINRAELIVDQVYSTNSLNNIFSAPINLYLDVKDSSLNNGSYTPIPCDFSATELQTGFQYMGGQLKTVTDSSGQQIGEYVFNISRYVQSVITKGKSSLRLRLSAPDFVTNNTTYTDWCGQTIGIFTTPRNNLGDGRVKINGTNNTPTRIRLRIIYSKL